MSSVYALISTGEITNIRYVGISRYNDPSVRLATHLENSLNQNYVGYDWPIYRWIRKHQSNGSIINCITLAHDISWDDACSMEIEKIKEFRSQGHALLNMTDGGEGTLGLFHSEETKSKMKNAAKARHKLLKSRGLVWGKDIGPQDKTPEELKQKILVLRGSGLSYAAIANYLNESNIPTARGKTWYASTVKNICDRF